MLKIDYIPIEKIKPYEKNAKLHPKEQIEQIKKSIKEFGFNDPLALWHGEIVEGHGRYIAGKELGMKELPVIYLDDLTDEQRRAYMLAHNKLTMNSGFDIDLLNEELAEIFDFNMGDFGFEIVESKNETYGTAKENANALSERFIEPPFSVLNGRKKEWLDRKHEWWAKIGDNTEMRALSHDNGRKTGQYEKQSRTGGVSLLDATLCEIMINWFTNAGFKSFDIFAGDTVFGYVSSTLGRPFKGIELRQEQVQFNNEKTKDLDAEYICDDARNVLNHFNADSMDFFFSCPPYFNLEKYSDLPNDASNQDNYSDFIAIIEDAFSKAINVLKENRFAVVVCGDVRGKDGGYVDFIGDIKRIFMKNGMLLYNDLILLDPLGCACIRANLLMANRKVVKVHQNVLVFYKGKQNKIKDVFPKIDVDFKKYIEGEYNEGENSELAFMD